MFLSTDGVKATNDIIVAPNFAPITVDVDTSAIENTVDSETGVLNFCGTYQFSLEEAGSNYGDYWDEFLPSYISVC